MKTKTKRRGGTPAAPPHGNRRVWAPAEVRLLGTMSDGRLARLLGLARRTVLMERQRRGIPPAHPQNRPGRRRRTMERERQRLAQRARS